MENKSIWSIRQILGYSLIQYEILKEEQDSYILKDLSCRDHKNCEIRVSLDLQYIEPINDSAKEYDYYHKDSKYFLSEKEARIDFYNTAKRLNLENKTRLEEVNNNIEKFLEYAKSKRYTKNRSTISYGTPIYTFDRDCRGLEMDIKNNKCDDYNNLLDKYIKSYEINSFKSIFSIHKGVESNEKHYYVDLREYDDDYKKVYVEVEKKDDTLRIIPQYDIEYENYYDNLYNYQYYAGEEFEEAATTINNCRYLIINNIKNGMLNILADNKRQIVKLEEQLNEYEVKLSIWRDK
jgi:hypothetical protein